MARGNSRTYDTQTHQKRGHPLSANTRKQVLLTDDDVNPVIVFNNECPPPYVTVNLIIHNTSAGDVIVTLRHLFALEVGTPAGTLKNQFWNKTIPGGETQLVPINKTMEELDQIVGWADVAGVITVHTDIRYQD